MNNQGKPEVKNYQLVNKNGKSIRLATKVIFDDGHEIAFTEILPAYKAIEQAKALKGSIDRLSI